MFVESKICEMDLRLVMYHESVKRLRRQLEILQQLHTAPTVYLTAVAEVVRRRTFSQAFLMVGLITIILPPKWILVMSLDVWNIFK
jgi:RB1-inducible coiled-coil protein 1